MREKFTLYAFVDLKPMERFEDGSEMCGFRSLNNSEQDSFKSVGAG